jgi:hypothetical protein
MGAAGRILTLTLALLLGLTCSCRHRAPASLAERPAQVRYRHGEPNSEAGVWLLERIEGARWDPALLAAARELSAGAADPGARLTPEAVRIATGRAGFPGDARFARLYNGGAHPEALLHDAMAAQGDAPSLDVALASRRYADGTVLWIMGVAPHWGEVDPYPRDLALDDSLALQVDVPGARELQLIVAPPHGLVQRMGISSGVARWVDLFHLPGEYRLEVVDVGRDRSRVVFDMAVFVEHEVPPRVLLPVGIPTPDPYSATEWLYQALDQRRVDAGLAPVQRFEPFEPLAREHAAYMASSGVLAHVIPGVTPGVGARAWDEFHPRAQHYEDLAAAYSPEEALALVWASPGHRNNLLCEHCTHASIGVALEPSVSSPPRLFVTWELLAFPEGTPVELPQTRR